jgi:hypothetical protein
MRPSAWHGYTKHLAVKVNKAVPVSHVSSTTLVKQTTKIAVIGCPDSETLREPKPERRRARDRVDSRKAAAYMNTMSWVVRLAGMKSETGFASAGAGALR